MSSKPSAFTSPASPTEYPKDPLVSLTPTIRKPLEPSSEERFHGFEAARKLATWFAKWPFRGRKTVWSTLSWSVAGLGIGVGERRTARFSVPGVTSNVSSQFPNQSLPPPPHTLSRPPWPLNQSLPRAPSKRSRPAPPNRMSSPAPPRIESSPASPLIQTGTRTSGST